MNSTQLLKFNDFIFDRFDDQFLEEYRNKSQFLQTQIYNKKLAKKNLCLLNEKNKNITEGLLQKKKDYENLKSELTRKLYSIQIITDKDKILSKMKFEEFLLRKSSQDLKKDSVTRELEELIETNSSLLQKCMKVISLSETTKKQYYKMIQYLRKNFREKVCEFSDTALKLKSVNNNCTKFTVTAQSLTPNVIKLEKMQLNYKTLGKEKNEL